MTWLWDKCVNQDYQKSAPNEGPSCLPSKTYTTYELSDSGTRSWMDKMMPSLSKLLLVVTKAQTYILYCWLDMELGQTYYLFAYVLPGKNNIDASYIALQHSFYAHCGW